MKRSLSLSVVLLVLAACGTNGGSRPATTTLGGTTIGDAAETTTTVPFDTTTVATSTEFPVTVQDDNGSVTIDAMPRAVVSLSTVATEMLFAVGASPQVVAVDDQSNYPADVPMTDLSGFTPNVEAILAYEPDLVFISHDPGDLVAALAAAGVPVINYTAAMTFDDVYHQIEAIGTATGHHEEAVTVIETISSDLEKIVDEAPGTPEGTTYFYELDNTLYTATSTTFFGQIFALFGLENIADAADADGAAPGYPQLSSEFVVAADPDLIFLADTLYGESAETVAARPGWDVLSAVQAGHVFALDSDVASRWGPRLVDFAQSVSDALVDYTS